ncbi:hypothetical protein HMPREF1544_01415 [Mucor circinelloides 1006PhL]|uniref:Uncharacterized protein n=1 Tax=Mucor circinelloides f. circinelloides (strain 1006PhL) TaxID=1220926 RepID=S2JP33_MUCC1|nr:hypothetical protein HMPREF1544_01415 [Mucor circinelloides 1006PhL]
MKKCAGALRCINEDCEQGYNVDIRPPIATRDSFKCIKKHNCMQLINCRVSVAFTFRADDITCENRGNTVTMMHNTEKEKKELNKRAKETPNITAAAFIAGIDTATGAIKRSIRNINKMLRSYGRATFEINRSKIQQGIILSANDVVTEFEDLEKHCPEFINPFQQVFCSPEMAKGELPFAVQPIITDVTYKAIPKGYCLCLSLIYMKKLDKRVVFSSSDHQKQQHSTFPVALLKKFDVKPEKVLGNSHGFLGCTE